MGYEILKWYNKNYYKHWNWIWKQLEKFLKLNEIINNN